MVIALIITGGIVLTTFMGVFFDYLGKRRKGKADPALEARIQALEKRVQATETQIAERDEKIAQLENDLSFTTKLIEDKTR